MRMFFNFLCVLFLFSFLIACQNNNNGAGNPKKDKKHVMDGASAKTTPVAYAEACALAYDKIYDPKSPNEAAIDSAYTESVGFYGPELLKYLNGLDSIENRQIRMVLGVYVDPDVYNSTAAADQKVNPEDYKKRVGRLTVFVWPFPVGNGNGHGHGHVGDCEGCAPLNFGTMTP